MENNSSLTKEIKKTTKIENIFYYLENFKTHVIAIVRGSYIGYIKIENINDMFTKWYLNSYSASKSYIPEKFDIINDLKYAHNKYGLNKPIEQIQSSIDNEIVILRKNAINAIDNFEEYNPIFSKVQTSLLKYKYTGSKEKYNYYLNFLSKLYSFMGGINNHLSVPPQLIKDNYIELFGTPVNTKYNFCSPFEIEKEYFGSLGSFFDFEFRPDCNYFANPPFDELIMHNMALRLIDQLDKVSNINIIVIIPKWEDFDCYNELISCKYIKDNIVVKKYDVKFYNYYSDKYVNIVDCYALFLTNIEGETNIFKNFIREWKKL